MYQVVNMDVTVLPLLPNLTELPPLVPCDPKLYMLAHGEVAVGLNHAQMLMPATVVVMLGSANACPLVTSPDNIVLPVCVNTAELLPLHGPAACVVGETPETVKGPSLPDASATILEESNV